MAQDVGLLKEKISRVYVPDVRPTAAMYEYTNPRNKYESIILLLDEDHTVQGLSAPTTRATRAPGRR